MKSTSFILSSLLLLQPALARIEFNFIEAPNRAVEGYIWPSEIPDDCPFEQSKLFDRIFFTGRFGDYVCGDTFYPTWADDGNLYSPWTDGWTDGHISYSDRVENALTGQAVLKGNDPRHLEIKNTAPPKVASALPYQGRYPAGSLVHNGVWYYGTYCLYSGLDGVHGSHFNHGGFYYNWPMLGPMPGFHISYDYGKSWTAPPQGADKPLFPEPTIKNGAVKMGAPHFVDFGQNMQHSPDGKAYLVAMGAEDNDPKPRPCIMGNKGKGLIENPNCCDPNFKHANLSWISADQIYLARVCPTPETINNEDAYEYFAGHNNKGEAIWSHDFNDIKALIEWNNNMGCVTVSYVPQLKRYLMCVTDGWPSVEKMDSYILESESLTGPWNIISYLKDFGEQSYFLNFPSKFIEKNGKSMWLFHSANFADGHNGNKLHIKPIGGRYGLSVHELCFLSPGEQVPPARIDPKTNIFEGNIAPKASISVSSCTPDTKAEHLTDSYVDESSQWASAPKGEKVWGGQNELAGEWVQLDWNSPQEVDRIILFDRPDYRQQICEGTLLFSDGSSIPVTQELPPSAYQGLQISFEPKKIQWVKFIITKHGWTTTQPGLSEFAVFPTTK